MNSLASQYPAFKVPRALGIALGAKKYTRHLPCVCQRMKLTFSCTSLYPPRIDAAFLSLNWKFIYNGIQVHPKQASARIIRKSRWNENAWGNGALPARPIDHARTAQAGGAQTQRNGPRSPSRKRGPFECIDGA